MNTVAAPPREVVGPLPRLLAFGIDLLWLLIVGLPWLWHSSPPGEFGFSVGGVLGLWALSLAAVPCWMALGGTPGQLMLHQQVIDAESQRPLSLLQAVLRWAAGWGTLLSLGFTPLWQGAGRRRQAWHDSLSGALVVDADVLGGSFFTRHAAGELPLAQSLCVVGLWLPLPLLLLLGAVDAAGQLSGGLLRLGSLLLLLGWPALLALMAWALLGVWRAAGRPGRRTPAGVLRAQAARVLMVLLLLGAVVWAAVQWAPRVPERAQLLIGRDPLGSATAALSADGRRLQIKGPLALGTAEQVRRVMDAAPQLRLVAVESTAGRLHEAQQIAALVRARQLPTRAMGECTGACTFVFLAGVRRQLMPGARLGFHRLSAGAFNPPYQGLLNRALGQRLAVVGLTPHLVTKTLASPPGRPWQPEGDELAAARLVSVPDRPLDVDLPAPQGAAVADYAEALSASPLWQALERRFPGVQALAAQRMGAASPQGAEAVQISGQEVVGALMPALLSQASPETRWLFTEVLLAQVTALLPVDPALCRSLLLGDVTAHRRLPPPLAWREAEWLLAALNEAPRGTPSRKPTSLELEVIRRTLGLRAPQHLADLWRPAVPPAPPEPSCERGQAMMSELSTLAAPQRRLALRLIYERE